MSLVKKQKKPPTKEHALGGSQSSQVVGTPKEFPPEHKSPPLVPHYVTTEVFK